ncbi:hypothetical protein RR48_08300 [Papilio machaon]|uniref:Uncharacterized protein n=1 Tax=Papilio machaon TaxID=76193 RepID=A0A194R187_PAPMA|nr:hypothetical protein RR48_08300 [Papilio machaon]
MIQYESLSCAQLLADIFTFNAFLCANGVLWLNLTAPPRIPLLVETGREELKKEREIMQLVAGLQLGPDEMERREMPPHMMRSRHGPSLAGRYIGAQRGAGNDHTKTKTPVTALLRRLQASDPARMQRPRRARVAPLTRAVPAARAPQCTDYELQAMEWQEEAQDKRLWRFLVPEAKTHFLSLRQRSK